VSGLSVVDAQAQSDVNMAIYSTPHTCQVYFSTQPSTRIPLIQGTTLRAEPCIRERMDAFTGSHDLCRAEAS
jgi:hypothetical protein